MLNDNFSYHIPDFDKKPDDPCTFRPIVSGLGNFTPDTRTSKEVVQDNFRILKNKVDRLERELAELKTPIHKRVSRKIKYHVDRNLERLANWLRDKGYGDY